MKTNEFIKKILKENIHDTSFTCSIYAAEGGHCGDSWNVDTDIEFSKEQLTSLLKERISDEDLFTDLKTEDFDVDEYIEAFAKEMAHPDGGLRATLESIIPEELTDLYEQLQIIDMKDEDEVADVKSQLKGIKDDDYTFKVSIGEEYEVDTTEETVHLTKGKILATLKDNTEHPELFEGLKLDKRPLYDEDITDRIDVSLYDVYSYGGNCDGLNNYLDSWETVINMIQSGDITKDNINEWLQYFKEEDFLTTIEDR